MKYTLEHNKKRRKNYNTIVFSLLLLSIAAIGLGAVKWDEWKVVYETFQGNERVGGKASMLVIWGCIAAAVFVFLLVLPRLTTKKGLPALVVSEDGLFLNTHLIKAKHFIWGDFKSIKSEGDGLLLLEFDNKKKVLEKGTFIYKKYMNSRLEQQKYYSIDANKLEGDDRAAFLEAVRLFNKHQTS